MKLFTAIPTGTLIVAPALANTSQSMKAAKQPAQRWHFHRLMTSQNADLLAETATSHTQSLLTYRTKLQGALHFSANMTEKLPPGFAVKVAFHSNKPHSTLSPPHTGNIAR